MAVAGDINIGTAGWSIARAADAHFAGEGSALERYAAVFRVAEINSSFHRPHRPSTWARWRDSVPDDFRFSAKLPKEITHKRKLVDCAEPLVAFLKDVAELGDKLGVLLVQLPPSLSFDPPAAERFFRDLASRSAAAIACEPRHSSWFEPEAEALLAAARVARVAADPAVTPVAAHPGGWLGLAYWRLHGSPVMYRSSYADRIAALAAAIAEQRQRFEPRDVWCIFDNTASSAATGDALLLRDASVGAAG